MRIPAYQIHNVLKMYGKQLTRDRLGGQAAAEANLLLTENPKLSAEGKRQAVISKVAADIVDRITHLGPQNEVDHEIVHQLEEELGQKLEFDPLESREAVFVFNTISEDNEKVTRRLSFDDADFLIKRLESLAKKMVDQNLEPETFQSPKP